LSTSPQFTGKQKGIVEALMRGEEVDEIALMQDTTRSYIYNTRSKARKLGLSFKPPRKPILKHHAKRQAQLEAPENPAGSPPLPQTSVQNWYVDALEYINYVRILRQPQPQQSQPAQPPPKFDISKEFEELSNFQMRLVEAEMKMMPMLVMYSALLRS